MAERLRRYCPWSVAAFWLLFYLAHPYRILVDDTTYRGILENKFFHYHIEQRYSRLLHDGLLYLQGFLFEPSMQKAMFVAILLHLLTGWITWRRVIPALPSRSQVPALMGLVAFLLHPVSMQTVVHVSQSGEVLGGVFLALSLAVFFRAHSSDPLPLTSRLSPLAPLFLALCGLAALMSKESYAVVPFTLAVLMALKTKSMPSTLAALALLSAILFGAWANSYSRPLIQNVRNYERSRAFHQAVEQGREISNDDSIFLPLRTKSENLKLQTALVPKLLQIVFVPFGLVKDYGNFPLGKETYNFSKSWPWTGVGGAILLGAVILGLGLRIRVGLNGLALLALPAIHYAVYWVFPVYDPLVLYRLYGVVYLTFVVALPALVSAKEISPPQSSLPLKGEARRKSPSPPEGDGMGGGGKRILIACCSIVVLGGFVRFWEMKDPIRETALELKRAPTSYRVYAFHMQELIKKDLPVDCTALLGPALTLAPSTALVHIEWAWCLWEQGQKDEARTHAQKALEQEAVPQNIPLLLDYLVGPDGTQFDLKKIHPFNVKYLPFKDQEPALRIIPDEN
ncbi:MAG: tetratricopeptide repeat protein [Nitrospirae bacterium]|nr:tetratricopeptide repeat protein [Nitrospirota bacterium]